MAVETINGASPDVWWGKFELAEGQLLTRRVGLLAVNVRRSDKEWQISFERQEELTGHPAALETAGPAAAPTPDRYVFRRTQARLQVLPALADRPVVTQPVAPFHVPAGEEAMIFVSSPLWVTIAVHDPPALLQEAPIVRPSDTWFGPSTRAGELCYATRTSARLSLEDVPLRPDRAVTPVRIRNRSQEALLLERLSLPVPFLSLFATPSGLLWTQAVTLAKEHDEELADMQLEESAPLYAERARLISEPRQKLDKKTLVRAFSALFR